MATFYIQLENKLLQISGELTAENISKALGYVPVSHNVTNELSQRIDNITFDSLKDNPLLQDGSGELNIVDEVGNIIAKINTEGIHSVDFIAGEHRLSDKTDKTYVDEAIKNVEVDLTGYATEEYVNNIDFYTIKDNPIANNGDDKLLIVDENGYIGLQLEEDGLYVKDIIADGHTLSQKADKSDIPSLDGYATESYVNTSLQNYVTKDEVSDLVDMSVVTELQEKVNTLIDTDADKSVRDIAVDVLTETLVSETATESYDTLAEMSAWIKSHPEDASAMNTAIQKNTTDIQSNATSISNLDAAYKAADTKVLTDAQEYTDNINFYTIKDNPIVKDEAGSITFVDETDHIRLKVTEDNIIVNDVVTPEHTLSNKADKSFVEDNYYNKATVDKKITEALTGGQVSLDGYATEQWVNEQGFLKTHQDISHLAEKSELPTKTSDLTNDSGFITIDDVPVQEIVQDTGNSTTAVMSQNAVTELAERIYGRIEPKYEKPSTGIPKADLASAVQTSLDKADTALQEHQDISHLASRNWVESQGYVHQEDLPNFAEFAKIEDIPILEDETGELNIVDESGNVGMKVTSEAVYAKDFIAGEHRLSEKVDKTYVDSSIAEIAGGGGGGTVTDSTISPFAGYLPSGATVIDMSTLSTNGDVLYDMANNRFVFREKSDIIIKYYANWTNAYLYNDNGTSNAIARKGKIFSYADKHWIATDDVLIDVSFVVERSEQYTNYEINQCKSWTNAQITNRLNDKIQYLQNQAAYDAITPVEGVLYLIGDE